MEIETTTSARCLQDVCVFRQVMPLAAHAPGLLRRRKFHSTFKHWIQCIRDFGAPYLYSGEANEEFHKVACKVCNQIGGLYQVSSRGLADIWCE